jgi:hypothetical protein
MDVAGPSRCLSARPKCHLAWVLINKIINLELTQDFGLLPSTVTGGQNDLAACGAAGGAVTASAARTHCHLT